MSMQKKYVRAPAVLERFAISNPTLCRWVKAGKFPAPRYLNGQRVWVESVIDAHEESLFTDHFEGEGKENLDKARDASKLLSGRKAAGEKKGKQEPG